MKGILVKNKHNEMGIVLDEQRVAVPPKERGDV